MSNLSSKKSKYILVGALAVAVILCGLVLLIGIRQMNSQAENSVISESGENSEVTLGTEEATDEKNNGATGETVNAENSDANASEDDAEPATEDVETQQTSVGDIDGNGVEEYFVTRNGDDDPVGHFDFYLNNECIYGYDDIVHVFAGSAYYMDLDSDGVEEIILSYFPTVNSMPLIQYSVLKKQDGQWKPMKIICGEDDLDNAFPIHLQFGAKKYELEISCDGYQPVITYDYRPHYEALLKDSTLDDVFYKPFQDRLQGKDYIAGAKFGEVLAWGIWEITASTYEGQNCLVAEHGLGGAEGKYDMLGMLNVYFHYTPEGEVEILNMEFIPEE